MDTVLGRSRHATAQTPASRKRPRRWSRQTDHHPPVRAMAHRPSMLTRLPLIVRTATPQGTKRLLARSVASVNVRGLSEPSEPFVRRAATGLRCRGSNPFVRASCVLVHSRLVGASHRARKSWVAGTRRCNLRGLRSNCAGRLLDLGGGWAPFSVTGQRAGCLKIMSFQHPGTSFGITRSVGARRGRLPERQVLPSHGISILSGAICHRMC